jgi:hypothetical protein
VQRLLHGQRVRSALLLESAVSLLDQFGEAWLMLARACLQLCRLSILLLQGGGRARHALLAGAVSRTARRAVCREGEGRLLGPAPLWTGTKGLGLIY